MSAGSRQIVHNVINDILECKVNPPANPEGLRLLVLGNAHELLRRVQGCAAECCTLADLMTACYQLGMSRALASVAAGLGSGPSQQLPDAVPDGYCP